MVRKPQSDGTIGINRKAGHRFEFLERLECGIALTGTEVKSLREKAVSLDEAYARILGGELWLFDAHIASYRFGYGANHLPTRRRKLLVHARQLRKLVAATKQKGLTLVPVRMYFNERGMAKVEIALAQGKGKSDRREDLKAKDHRREMDRAMRRGGRGGRS
ncbi:MAG: SsrA-binding protein SmpB [Phycisphaerae bacterium]|nr:SsrA-binding protein SmpB [Phycisphaerae bacterium]